MREFHKLKKVKKIIKRNLSQNILKLFINITTTKKTKKFIQTHFSQGHSTNTFVTDPKQSKSFETLFWNHNFWEFLMENQKSFWAILTNYWVS